ncbi:sugar O-acetyltransferase [Telmatospirillum sp. J64-1]|uniref:sugar O-acetyltransferase n=1 Tax=Telmatospirillum sp. J64-1 TaxID=2502183 RepID=UPI00115CA58C|nr:sugar O-acetyltransferase [Telmatospirillum sp. J64-1]
MTGKSEKQKMLDGDLYNAAAPELVAGRSRADRLMAAFNAAPEDRREEILRELLGSVGENTVIRPDFRCDYGENIKIGRNVFINFNCVFLDCAAIEIGDFTQIAPAVQFYTATHPLDPGLRRDGQEYALPIRVGTNVWIGGGAIILPGVTIGDDSVIAAGSVVTKDVPPRSVVVGNPARVVREV